MTWEEFLITILAFASLLIAAQSFINARKIDKLERQILGDKAQ